MQNFTKYFPNWLGGWLIILTIGGTLFIGLPYLVYSEVKFAKSCKANYYMGRPSLCVSNDGRILDVH